MSMKGLPEPDAGGLFTFFPLGKTEVSTEGNMREVKYPKHDHKTRTTIRSFPSEEKGLLPRCLHKIPTQGDHMP